MRSRSGPWHDEDDSDEDNSDTIKLPCGHAFSLEDLAVQGRLASGGARDAKRSKPVMRTIAEHGNVAFANSAPSSEHGSRAVSRDGVRDDVFDQLRRSVRPSALFTRTLATASTIVAFPMIAFGVIGIVALLLMI